MPLYEPIVTEVRMSDYGYWVVTISCAPGRRVSIMVCTQGITPETAESHALDSLGLAVTPPRRYHAPT